MCRKTRTDKGKSNPNNSRKNNAKWILSRKKLSGWNAPRALQMYSTLIITTHGIPYILIKLGPHWKDWKKFHRYIMEQHLNRQLDPSEHVHHINGNTLDNRIENLALTNSSKHIRHHRLASIEGKWSLKYEKCRRCGTTEKRHAGRGLCSTCIQRERFEKLGYWQ